jgi:hypothetical protein
VVYYLNCLPEDFLSFIPRSTRFDGSIVISTNRYDCLTENEKLFVYYVQMDKAAVALKSTSGWDDNGNGTNSSGFSGLPG